MADYRELSQEYAQGGIKAAILLNGGAAVALLSQAGDLIERHLVGAVVAAMLIWAVGTTSAAATWALGFLSTRYVDKSEKAEAKGEEALHRHYLALSDRFMTAGLATLAVSLLFFIAGCFALAWGFSCSS